MVAWAKGPLEQCHLGVARAKQLQMLEQCQVGSAWAKCPQVLEQGQPKNMLSF